MFPEKLVAELPSRERESRAAPKQAPGEVSTLGLPSPSQGGFPISARPDPGALSVSFGRLREKCPDSRVR